MHDWNRDQVQAESHLCLRCAEEQVSTTLQASTLCWHSACTAGLQCRPFEKKFFDLSCVKRQGEWPMQTKTKEKGLIIRTQKASLWRTLCMISESFGFNSCNNSTDRLLAYTHHGEHLVELHCLNHMSQTVISPHFHVIIVKQHAPTVCQGNRMPWARYFSDATECIILWQLIDTNKLSVWITSNGMFT